MTLTRFVTTTAIAIVLALPAATGFAQSPAAPSAAPPAASTAPRPAPVDAGKPTTAAATARHMRDNEMRASKLIGASVYNTGDQKLGSIAELIVDRDGKVNDVVIGLGDKHVAVKMTELKPGKDDRLVLSTTKDALSKMAAYDLKHEPARSGSSTAR